VPLQNGLYAAAAGAIVYGLRDNLLVGWDSRTVLILNLNGTTSTTAPLSSAI
jgi:hypothetical protein